MKPVIEHITGMMHNHHVECFEEMVVLPNYLDYTGPPTDHRRINIKWIHGRGKVICTDLIQALGKYKDFRCIDANINGLSSSLRLVRGQLKAVEEYHAKLETRLLTSFEYGDQLARMEFVPRLGDVALSDFEIDKLPFLETIADYQINYGPGYAILMIDSFNPKKALVPENWIPEAQGIFGQSDYLKNPFESKTQRVKFPLKDDTEADVGIGQLLKDTMKMSMDQAYDLRGKMKEYIMPEPSGGVFNPAEYGYSHVPVKCKDCKDGFYYPLVGPREPCRTCQS